MTDAQINALVAQHIYGDNVQQDDRGWYIQATGNNWRWPIADYCNDDISWCGLLYRIAKRAMLPQILCQTDTGGTWAAHLQHKRKVYLAEAHTPGRALCIAALRAYGVEVE